MNRVLTIIGVALVLGGGAILAFMDGTEATAVGTTVALAGLVLALWGWFARTGDQTP